MSSPGHRVLGALRVGDLGFLREQVRKRGPAELAGRFTPAHHGAITVAYLSGFPDLIPELLALGADPDATLPLARNPRAPALLFACSEGQTDLLRALIAHGARIEITDATGQGPWHYAARSGHVRCLRELIGCAAPIDTPDSSGRSALHEAATGGHGPCVHALLDAGADPNRGSADLPTPLYCAVPAASEDAAIALLDHGADPNRACRDGLSPLHLAVLERNLHLARRLLDAGGEPGARCAEGRTAADLCALWEGADRGIGELLAAALRARRLAPDARQGVPSRDDLSPSLFGLRGSPSPTRPPCARR